MRKQWSKCDVYVVRLNPSSELKKSKKQNNNYTKYKNNTVEQTYGNNICYSRPCSICVQKMVRFGVKRVFYSTSDQGWQTEKGKIN